MFDNIQNLFDEYGYGVLFLGLLLEFIALPFPGETTMVYAGYLAYEGVLRLWPAFLYSFAGTTIGMTITYFIGNKAGMPFLERFGKWVMISPAKLAVTKKWFDKYGNMLVFIGYFIPGVRHVTGYFAGIIGSPFRTFIAFAYSGALFWCVCFIGLGYVFGPQWDIMLHAIEENIWKVLVPAGCIVLVIFVLRWRKRKQSNP